jgi:hypothetical protein
VPKEAVAEDAAAALQVPRPVLIEVVVQDPARELALDV